MTDSSARPIRDGDMTIPGAVVDGEYGQARIRPLGDDRYELAVQPGRGTFPALTVLSRRQLYDLLDMGCPPPPDPWADVPGMPDWRRRTEELTSSWVYQLKHTVQLMVPFGVPEPDLRGYVIRSAIYHLHRSITQLEQQLEDDGG